MSNVDEIMSVDEIRDALRVLPDDVALYFADQIMIGRVYEAERVAKVIIGSPAAEALVALLVRARIREGLA